MPINGVYDILCNETAVRSQQIEEFFDDFRSQIFDFCSPIDLIRWTSVNRRFREIIQNRFKHVFYLEIFKADITKICSTAYQRKIGAYSEQQKTVQILSEANDHSLKFILHHECTAVDIQRLFSAIRLVAPSLRTLSLNVSILELVIAGISSIDLARWYSFQCYLRKIIGTPDEEYIHVHCLPTAFSSSFFPVLKEVTIHIGDRDFGTLSRLRDYAVEIDAVFPMCSLEIFRLNLVSDTKHYSSCNEARRKNSKQLAKFKSWIGASSLTERYCQQFT